MGFDPALSSTRVLGEDTPSFLKENTFDYSGSSKPDINLSTSSSQSMSSINSTISNPDNCVMSDASDNNPEIIPEHNPQEELLDLSPPFNVTEGDEGLRLILIIKGTKNSGDILVSECHGHNFIKNRERKNGNLTFRCTGNKYHGCYAQCEVKDPKKIMRERGDEPDTRGPCLCSYKWC